MAKAPEEIRPWTDAANIVGDGKYAWSDPEEYLLVRARA